MKAKLEAVGNHPTLGLVKGEAKHGKIWFVYGGPNPIGPEIVCPNVVRIVFSMNGRLIAAVDESRCVRLWDIVTRLLLWEASMQDITADFDDLSFGLQDELVFVSNNFTVLQKFDISTGAIMA